MPIEEPAACSPEEQDRLDRLFEPARAEARDVMARGTAANPHPLPRAMMTVEAEARLDPAMAVWPCDPRAIPEVPSNRRDEVRVEGVVHYCRSLYSGEVTSETGLNHARQLLVENAEARESRAGRTIDGRRLAFRDVSIESHGHRVRMTGEVVELVLEVDDVRVLPAREQASMARRRGERRRREDVVRDLRRHLRDHPDDIVAEAALLALDER